MTEVAVLGVAALLEVQHLKLKRLMAENAELRTPLAQLSSSSETNELLVQQLKAAIAASQTNQNELLRLRGQGSRLRQLELENAQLRTERQQSALHRSQYQPALPVSEPGHVTAVSEAPKATAADPHPYKTDLGALELQGGIAVHFDLGGGTNCTVTPSALADGNNLAEIRVDVTNPDGTISELATSRLTGRPGRYCSSSVGDRMIALAVTLKP